MTDPPHPHLCRADQGQSGYAEDPPDAGGALECFVLEEEGKKHCILVLHTLQQLFS